MKVKLLTTISFFTYQLTISQTEKLLHGKVIAHNAPLNRVEVINKTAQTSTQTNNLGEFSILVKAQDSLIFFSKKYFFKRLKISAIDLEINNLVVELNSAAEELEDVLIINIKPPKIINNTYNREEINKIKIRKQFDDVTSKVNVYDGRIKNALNYNHAIFDKPRKKIKDDNRFKELVIASCPLDFFIKNLNIKAEEKEKFLNFCDVDPQSKILLEHPNVLALMDFLYLKSNAFKKLSSEFKN